MNRDSGKKNEIKPLNIRGFEVYKGLLDVAAQRGIVQELRQIVSAAPLFSPKTRWGKPMSVRMTSAGKYGWFSDQAGYRYIPKHPDGSDWPDIPDSILAIWRDLVSKEREPDCCLVNLYQDTAKMGLHQDNDEKDFSWPVLSISLGDDGLFRVGGENRAGPTESIWLSSGDVVVMGGSARLAYHGVDRIKSNSSTLLASGGRLNLTLRVVD